MLPGKGDYNYWECDGHPNDPRTDDMFYDYEEDYPYIAKVTSFSLVSNPNEWFDKEAIKVSIVNKDNTDFIEIRHGKSLLSLDPEQWLVLKNCIEKLIMDCDVFK